MLYRFRRCCCFKAATAELAFSNPRLEESVTIPLAWVAGAGAHICAGTCERIR
jgi:hypothetical protein